MVSFSDIKFHSTVTPAAISNRAFGGYPSVSNYYSNQSTSSFPLSRAPESNTTGGGAVNDGVVLVTSTQTRAQFQRMAEADQNKAALELADPFVHFESFDTRIRNDAVDRLELVISRIDAEVTDQGVLRGLDTGGGGSTRGVTAVSLDGKRLGGQAVGSSGSGASLNLWIHEVAHAALDTNDFYGFGIGVSDLMGPSITGCFQPLSTFNRMHLGWGTAIPVTQDGYKSIPRFDASGVSYLLYDYSKGRNHYFVVENRLARAGTYDTCTDSGLIIYRVDETKIKDANRNDDARPIALEAPAGETATSCGPDPTDNNRINCSLGGNYRGGTIDAWDPSDSRTRQRVMENRPWEDGTASNVAVRAIMPRNSIRQPNGDNDIVAYFDVRGPGILVDPFTLDEKRAPRGERTIFDLPVRNTGETRDSFRFDFDNLPAGWTSTPVTRSLAAGEETVVPVQVTPPFTATGTQGLAVRGTSTTDPSVTSISFFDVDVSAAKVSVDGQVSDDEVHVGEPVTYSATVTRDPGTDLPPTGSVLFYLYGPDDANCERDPVSVSAGSIDGLTSTATSEPFTPTQAGVYRWRAQYPGDGKYTAAAADCNSVNSTFKATATPWSATIIGPNGGSSNDTTSDSTPTFTWTTSRPETYSCYFDSEAPAPCSGPGQSHTPTEPLTNGDHKFVLRSTNSTSTTHPYNLDAVDFTVDTNATEQPLNAVRDNYDIEPGKKTLLEPDVTANDTGEFDGVGIVNQPTHGNLTRTDETAHDFSYEPDEGFTGTDTFQYRLLTNAQTDFSAAALAQKTLVETLAANCDTATVTLNVRDNPASASESALSADDTCSDNGGGDPGHDGDGDGDGDDDDNGDDGDDGDGDGDDDDGGLPDTGAPSSDLLALGLTLAFIGSLLLLRPGGLRRVYRLR
jgi:M6 family metalloprotease-like protein